ncbi:iron permease FTR1/Fip1/EfeU [Umbelopsis sp. PMI_123]|nr:iron permease FTR1/Fip1/EfeU [Umbelopsis sp. PMI_123]
MAQDLFSVPIFFILFRETTEAAIIVSVLLSFLKQVFSDDRTIYRRLCKQVWFGSIAGLVICLAIGAAFIAVWYTVASDLWSHSEDIWEGCFSLVASILITVMGIAMLRTEKMQDKWKIKLAKSMEAQAGKQDLRTKSQRYAFFILPFITVLREGLEAIVFLGGVSLGEQAKSIPIAAIMGIICGCLVGYLLYRGGSLVKLHWFFVISTCILYLVAAGLLSKAVGYFEQNAWNQVIGGESAEEGGDVITYKVTTAVWHVSWGDPELNTDTNGGWQIFNAILGWNNTATIGSIVTYCGYWIVVSAVLVYLHFKEKREEALHADDEKINPDLAIKKAAAIVNAKEKNEQEETVEVDTNGKV